MGFPYYNRVDEFFGAHDGRVRFDKQIASVRKRPARLFALFGRSHCQKLRVPAQRVLKTQRETTPRDIWPASLDLTTAEHIAPGRGRALQSAQKLVYVAAIANKGDGAPDLSRRVVKCSSDGDGPSPRLNRRLWRSARTVRQKSRSRCVWESPGIAKDVLPADFLVELPGRVRDLRWSAE